MIFTPNSILSGFFSFLSIVFIFCWSPEVKALEFFKICNMNAERKPVYVSISYSSGYEDTFVQGWSKINFEQCKIWNEDEVINSPRIAYNVFNKDYIIGKGGKISHLCVNIKNDFLIHHYPGVYEDLNTKIAVTTEEHRDIESICKALGNDYKNVDFALTEDLQDLSNYTVNLD